MGNLKNLFQSSVADNLFHGSIPREIGALSNMELLDFSSNDLSGSIQGSTAHCLKLRYLNLSQNNFKGNIPAELGVLFNLLDLRNNQFVEAIPGQLSGLIMLANLNLSHNELSGTIPASFQIMQSITYIDESYNELGGCASPILHRDITSNNILLDLEFRACISDFGMAKISQGLLVKISD
ncbi:receptor-like protein kinase 5 [Lolium rigidum]|uniref:receptor-like protein kinase 5 n=1 Tax=Lolium rigidum TaxID=89674 RepID=UPI001F5CD0C2|nr:receptor-like protein kinase 5 [Lolium rigidum]